MIRTHYATFLIKSKHGHFLQRLFSPFLNFLQQLIFTFSGSSIPNFRNFLIAFFFFFLPTIESDIQNFGKSKLFLLNLNKLKC